MALFTTIAVFDQYELGHGVKVTYPFCTENLSTLEIVELVKGYTPTIFHLIIPGSGIFDVKKMEFRPTEISYDWQVTIDTYVERMQMGRGNLKLSYQ